MLLAGGAAMAPLRRASIGKAAAAALLLCIAAADAAAPVLLRIVLVLVVCSRMALTKSANLMHYTVVYWLMWMPSCPERATVVVVVVLVHTARYKTRPGLCVR